MDFDESNQQKEQEIQSTSSEEQIDLQDVTYRDSSPEIEHNDAFPSAENIDQVKLDQILEPTNPKTFVSETPELQNDQEKQNVDPLRPRPEKQLTISGNNPFRSPEGEESSPLVDDKYARVFSTTHEESDPEIDINDEKNAVRCESVNKSQKERKDFDPLKTIYPDERSESDSSWSEDEMKKIKKIRIRDRKMKSANSITRENEEGKENFLLPAPPKITTNLAYQEPLAPLGENEEVDKTPKPREEVTNTWNVDLDGQDERERHFNLLKAFEAARFMVDWQAPIPKYIPTAIPTGKPVAVLPELPREETPDPELDIPFHPEVTEDQVWRLWIRHPEKKSRVKQMSKYTTDRTWKEIGVTLGDDRGRCTVNLHDVDENGKVNKDTYRTVRVEPYMQLSRDKLQQYDKYGKLHIFKLNHVSYRELVGIRPEKFTLKNLQNLVSHKPKQNVALDHIPVYSEILKFGSLDHSPIISLMASLEDRLMLIPMHKDTSLNYTKQEVCCYVIDEYHGKVNNEGIIQEQKARTRIFCSAFVNEGPHIVLGVNDKWRYGREVVRRSDILPIMHDDWISIKKPEFHKCVEMEEYEEDHMIRFYPLDGCKFELMRFRVSLVQNLQLPMQVKVDYSIDGRYVIMRCDLLVPGFFTACRHKGAVPCENVEIHIPVPEEWIYHFRIEKPHKMGSVHSTLRKPGKIKGLERITAMAQSFLPPSILETSIGVAKYEHLYKAVVWRILRVPEKHEASFRPHLLTCKLLLEEHDEVPEWNTLITEAYVEYTMPSSTVSGATIRSISVETSGIAEKFVKYTSKYFYTVGINYKLGERKEPPLKSVLDKEVKENTDDEEEEESDEESESESESESKSEEDKLKPNNKKPVKNVKKYKKETLSESESSEKSSSSSEDEKKKRNKNKESPKVVKKGKKKVTSSSEEEKRSNKKSSKIPVKPSKNSKKKIVSTPEETSESDESDDSRRKKSSKTKSKK